MSGAISLFAFYRDHPPRRLALKAPPGAGERSWLFGLDELRRRGVRVSHNLEPQHTPGRLERVFARALNRLLVRLGGYGGDFATLLACRAAANRSDVVLSTVDTVGIPLVLAKHAGFVRRPIVYVAVGLPERLAQLRGARVKALYRNAYRRVHTIVTYSLAEAEALGRWLGVDAGNGPRRVFLPLGVDLDYFHPQPDAVVDVDVVSIGADPQREFGLLLGLAERRPELSIRIVTSSAHAASFGLLPANVLVEVDIPFSSVRDRLVAARVVVLPVRENSYSGATTVLLQAMASGKPIVVSRTRAISDGYHLVDGENCLLVQPGHTAAFEAATSDLLSDRSRAARLGSRARETAERYFAWDQYGEGLWRVLSEAACSKEGSDRA